MTRKLLEASIAYPNFLDWVNMNHTFEALAAYCHTNFNLTGSGEAQRLNAVEISASFFPLLGVETVIGRNFSLDDDRQGAAPRNVAAARGIRVEILQYADRQRLGQMARIGKHFATRQELFSQTPLSANRDAGALLEMVQFPESGHALQ